MQPRIRDLRRYEADVVLKDGSKVHLRPIRADDTDAWLFLFSRLSPRTIYLRFHHVIAEVTKAEAETYTNIGYENNFALVAILGEPPDQRIIAIGRFARLANTERASEEAVREAFETIRERLRAAGRLEEMEGAVVQEMVPGGVEVIVGLTQDPSFGPLIMFGLGGIQVELIKDVAFRIHPLTDVDARDMVRSIKGYPLLTGWRGSPPADVEALEQLLLRVSAMVEDIPEIAEMDLNPVKVLSPGEGCCVVDARILLQPVE